jgi:ElaB/YqjD/DUF883 family membrane-anchored ribosome-binding protein
MSTQTPTKDANGRVSSGTPDFSTPMQSAERDFRKVSHDAGARVGAMASNITDSSYDYYQDGRKYVKEHPARSIAIAAAAGVVAGSHITLLMSRSR